MKLAFRNLRYYWRTHIAAALGAAAASAAIAGALLVGDSMRGSLRDAALNRIGRISQALTAPHFFREALADELCGQRQDEQRIGYLDENAAPLILLSGGVTHADTQRRIEHVQVLGVDERFWNVAAGRLWSPAASQPTESARTAVLNAAAAAELGAAPGDEIVVRIGKPSVISTETILGRRDDATRSLRLTVAAIAPDDGPAAFSIAPRQVTPLNVFVPLDALQRVIDQRERINAIVTSGTRGAKSAQEIRPPPTKLLSQFLDLADFGLQLRLDDTNRYLALESDRQLIEPPIETAARAAATELGASTTDVFAYLANELRIEPPRDGRAIPYSTVVGLSPSPTNLGLTLVSGQPAPILSAGDVLLNEWAATTLAAHVGDRVALDYYLTDETGHLATRTAAFTLRGIVALHGAAADPGFVPPYPGVTDARRMTDWDPPFPVDFTRVTDADEDYWEKHRTTPKAFVALADAQRLWAEDADRLGRLTAIRFYPKPGQSLPALADTLRTALRDRIDPAQLGFALLPLRAQALAASSGNTDFGGLFIGFSFFLIASALLLAALLFRLGIERRARELGLLAAVGFSRRSLTGLLLVEGAGVALVGTLLGLLLAPAYASLMLAGLRSQWSGAVNAPFLNLYIAPGTLETAAVIGVAVSLLSIAWTTRGVLRISPRGLLAGATATPPPVQRRRGRATLFLCLLAAGGAIALVAASTLGRIPSTPAFFGSGALALTGALAFIALRLNAREHGPAITRPGLWAWVQLGLRNAARNPGRSLLTAGLIASSSFLIAALGAFRIETTTDPHEKSSGTGGFPLFAEAAVPLPYDLNTEAGRDSLGLASTPAEINETEFIPFRLRPGDASSCLNLYRGTRPRILGAGDRFLARGGFVFSATLADTDEERANPWLCLKQRFDDGAIPVIGDEAAVKWQLHKGLGQDLVIQDGRGQNTRLRFVALLSGSALQDELLIAESDFRNLFPAIEGHAFFLIAPPPHADTHAVADALERGLAPFAFDVGSTSVRIAGYNRVQNTYLATFQSLGGFGLMLGTIGLAAVLLRNVWERRSEFGLLAALGFSRMAQACIVLAESAALLMAGLLAGILPALLAVAPQLAARPAAIPLLQLAGTLGGVLLIGMLSSVAALAFVLRTPPLRALRSE